MINVQGIDELAQRLAALVPPGLAEAQRDIEANMRAVLRSGLERMDLVSREEFDVQRCVLLRTREKVEALEAQVVALEAAVAAMRRRES
jgi:BMFP domain-containing protein YqiC